MQSLDELRDAAIAHINDAADGPTLEQLRVDYLGKKGKLTGLLKGLGQLSAEQKAPFEEEYRRLRLQYDIDKVY